MKFFKYAIWLALAMILAACGGGGGNPGTSAGGSTSVPPVVSTAPTISLELKNSANASATAVTALDVFSLRATVKDAAGSVLAGQVVQFSGDASLFKFSSSNGTGLTDANGVASIQVSPALATSSGAGTLKADVTVAGTSATQATLGVQVLPLATGGTASATMEMRSPSNVLTSTIFALDTNTLRVTVKDSIGNLLPAQAVTLSSSSGLVKFSPAASALTDLNGVATVNVLRSQSTSVGADTISAAVRVAGVAVTPATVNVFVSPLVNGGLPSMTLGLRDQLNVSTSTLLRNVTTFAQVQLLGPTGVAPIPTLVTLSGDASMINFPSGATGLSDSAGVARIPVTVVSGSPGGAGTLRAAASVEGSSVSASFDYQIPAGASAGAPTLSLGLAGGGNSVSASGFTNAQATVKDASGVAVSGKLVTFSGNTALIKFSPASGQVLTDSSGVASIQVSPTSLTSAGASTLVAQTTVGSTTLSSSFDYQLAAANLGLQSLNLGSGSLAAYGNRPISVLATINGVPATATPVQVTFNASCGTVTPSVVTTDSTGTASTTYTASLATCAGTNVTVSASAVGAASVSGTVAVAASIATNVQFISTTPQLIYLKDSVGTTQAQVVFRVVDSNGNPLQNKKLRLSLSNSATGVSLDTVGNTVPVDLTTDSAGLVSTAVFSGTVPTSLNVRAALLNDSGVATNVFSNSNLLTVASGRPTQSSLSLAREKFSIEGFNVDGVETKVTLSMADRQGNPVPPGTQINFVTESGVMLPAVCFVPPVIPATASSPAIPVSSCSVTIRSSGTRTINGRVSVLAYTAGEENFVDVNGNNIFDAGDTFSDLGRASRDNVGGTGIVGVYDTGEFQVPREGTAACTPAAGCVGDGVWGAADVRQQATIVFATSQALITGSFDSAIVLQPAVPATATSPALPASMVTPGLSFSISDLNGNSVPTGSTIVATATDNTISGPRTSDGTGTTNTFGTCAIIANRFAGSPLYAVPNSIESFASGLALKECTTGDFISIKVTTPLGFVTQRDFVIP